LQTVTDIGSDLKQNFFKNSDKIHMLTLDCIAE